MKLFLLSTQSSSSSLTSASKAAIRSSGGDCSPGKAGGIKVSRSKQLDGAAARPLAPPYGGQVIS